MERGGLRELRQVSVPFSEFLMYADTNTIAGTLFFLANGQEKAFLAANIIQLLNFNDQKSPLMAFEEPGG